MSVMITRPGARLHVTDRAGDGRPIVLTHGAGMDESSFADIAAALHADGHRTITWDLRGHGRSPLDAGTRFSAAAAEADLAAIADLCGAEPPILVGHSLGGNLSQALVRHDPARAAGLIVIGATANTGPLTAAERFALRHLSAPILALVPAGRLPSLMAGASAVTPEAVVRIREVFARMPKSTFIDVWRATADLVAPDPSYRTPVPLALIRGDRDGTGNIATAMETWALRDGVSVRIVPGAGHVAMWDAPEETLRQVRAAIADITTE